MAKMRGRPDPNAIIEEVRHALLDPLIEDIEDEIDYSDPPEVKLIYNTLLSKGYQRDEILRMMALMKLQLYHRRPKDSLVMDTADYVEALLRLPVVPDGDTFTPNRPKSEPEE